MDAVITYVNGLDPAWQEVYRNHVPVADETKRFRDWGTLKYLMRGIETCLPFINNLHLVVAAQSQVPKWIDRTRVKVVLHQEIIPESLLPVFNSCTIEMFLHRIDGLSEEFIYFNDDMFPLKPCLPTDFFDDGKGSIGMSPHFLACNMYKLQCRISDRLARKALGLKPSPFFMRPQHICSPMLKSANTKVYEKLENEIMATASPIRTPDNPNQYLFLDYMYYAGLLVPRRISNTHISQGVWSAEKIADFILHPRTNFACINDVSMSDEKFIGMQRQITEAFENHFPHKSSFEL